MRQQPTQRVLEAYLHRRRERTAADAVLAQPLTLHSTAECILHCTMARWLRIGEMAKQAGVKVSTLRYYDACGLLPPAYRAVSGYRFYTPDQLERLQFILGAKRLGLSLRQIRQMLQISDAGGCPCERVAPLFRRLVARLDERIAQLQARRDALEHALTHVPSAHPSSPCELVTLAIDYQRRCKTMARLIEVFTAGCPLCDEAVQRVKQAVAQCGCTVVTRTPDSPEAQQYSIRAVPAIVVDGQLLFVGVPTQEQANALLSR
jgi:MerR family transcriptional regulator, copper efflux regulator